MAKNIYYTIIMKPEEAKMKEGFVMKAVTSVKLTPKELLNQLTEPKKRQKWDLYLSQSYKTKDYVYNEYFDDGQLDFSEMVTL